MKWMKEELKLDAEQRGFLTILKQQKGNYWIKGHAGSGKSILLVHSVNNFRAANMHAKIAIVVFTHAMIDMLSTGLNDIGLSDIPIMTFFEFEKNGQHYDIIFVDEVQDLPEQVFQKIKNRSKSLIVAGDQMQSIYEERISPRQINAILNGTEISLNHIHRLTPSLISLVIRFIGNVGNILGAKINKNKKDVQIRLGHTKTKNNEIKYIINKSQEFSSINEPTAILLPTHNDILHFCGLICDHYGQNHWERVNTKYGKPDYNSLNSFFKNRQINFMYVGNRFGSLEAAVNNGKVIIMTYHSSKGLDFESVFLPFLTSELKISANSAEKAETVFMVALTRSRNNVFLSYHGDAIHPYLERFSNEDFIVRFDIDNEMERKNTSVNTIDW